MRRYLQQMITSLQALREQASVNRRAPSPVLAPLDTNTSAESSRTVSPAPSTSSESSSSTHTATPISPRLNATKSKGQLKALVSGMTHIQSSPSTSSSSQSISSVGTSTTVTPANSQAILSRRNTQRERPAVKQQSSLARSRMNSASPIPRPPRSLSLDPPSSAVTRSPSVFTILRSSIDASFHHLTKSKASTFILLLIIFPVLSLVFRLRRRKTVTGSSSGMAQSVRRRLQSGALQNKGVVAGVWGELVRSVVDTVKMGGRGLV